MERIELKPKFTGRTIRMVSPMTGKLQTYRETLTVYVSSPATNPVHLSTLESNITADIYANGVDGFCDGILLIYGVVEDTYRTRVWVAEEQVGLAQHGRLIGLWTAVAICATIAFLAIVALATVVILTQSVSHLAAQIMGNPPTYVGGTPDDPQTFDNYSEYYTSQTVKYWYVCPKCGAGFALKSDYPNLEDVPQSIVNLYNEHVANCMGIPQGPQNVPSFLMTLVILGAVAIGGMFLVSKVTGEIFT